MCTSTQKRTAGSASALTVFLVLLFVSSMGLFAPPPPTAYAAGTLYVKATGTSSNTCADWANACDLQTAIGKATSGNEIWVAAGTYYPTDETDRTISFNLKSGVAIYGGFPTDNDAATMTERDWESNVTTLSGDIGTENDASDNSYQVVSNDSVDNTAILDGFTITAGQANGMMIDNGGGMSNSNSSPTLTNIIFSGNLANYGGGMHNSNNSNPTLTNVIFSGNTGTEYIGYGGGMYNSNSKPTLTNVIFSGNSVAYSGGGMTNYESHPTLTNVIFRGNSAKRNSGGMYNQKSNPTLTNVTFSGNSAAQKGGGMYNETGSPTLTNVTFSGNSAAEEGGGMYNIDVSTPTIQNSIFWGNSATSGGDEIYNDNGTPIIIDKSHKRRIIDA